MHWDHRAKSLTLRARTTKTLMQLSEIAPLLTQHRVVKVGRSARSGTCVDLYLSVVKNGARD